MRGFLLAIGAAQTGGSAEGTAEALLSAASAGFAGAELHPSAVGLHYGGTLTTVGLDAVAVAVSSAGVPVPVLHAPVSLSPLPDPTGWARAMFAMLDMAEAFGSGGVVAHMPEGAGATGRAALLSGLGVVLPEYASSGVSVLLEAVPHHSQSWGTRHSDAAGVAAESGSSTCLDTGHEGLYSAAMGIPPLAFDPAAVGHVHLHDNAGLPLLPPPPGRYRSIEDELRMGREGYGDTHLQVGRGSIPLGEMVARVDSVPGGYGGWVTLEPSPTRAWSREALLSAARAVCPPGW